MIQEHQRMIEITPYADFVGARILLPGHEHGDYVTIDYVGQRTFMATDIRRVQTCYPLGKYMQILRVEPEKKDEYLKVDLMLKIHGESEQVEIESLLVTRAKDKAAIQTRLEDPK